jgi:aspartate-semialdehyde dehydrogenase
MGEVFKYLNELTLFGTQWGFRKGGVKPAEHARQIAVAFDIGQEIVQVAEGIDDDVELVARQEGRTVRPRKRGADVDDLGSSHAPRVIEPQNVHRMSGERSESEIFSQSLAFDCLPQIGSIAEDGETSDEQRLRGVLRRLLENPSLPIELTRVRIPTLGGSLAAVHAELAKPVTLDEATALWAAQQGIGLLGDEELPTPRGSLGHDDAAVGRVRASGGRLAFVVALNDLRLGAALGVVGAAEALTT